MRQIRATHHYSFRTDDWAELIGEAKVDIGGRPGRHCYVVRFDDGMVDLWPVEDGAAGYEFRDAGLEHPASAHIAIVDGRPKVASLAPISQHRVEQLQAEHGRAPGDDTYLLPLESLPTPEFDHELKYEGNGDGWNEPFVDWWSCSCGQLLAEWVQTDPEHTGRPYPDEVFERHAEHVREQVAVWFLSALAVQPDQIPGPDSSTFMDELRGYLYEATRDNAPLGKQDLFEYYLDLRKRYLKPIRDWMDGVRSGGDPQ